MDMDIVIVPWYLPKLVVCPQGKKELYFHNSQAAAKKDVEMAFGILQPYLLLYEVWLVFEIKRSFGT